MKQLLKQNKGISMIALVITILIILVLTSMLIYNAQDTVNIKRLNNLYNDIDLLRGKIEEYYNEYGKIPAKIKYTNIQELESVLSNSSDVGDFYVIDLEAMKGITLNYGKDYKNIKENNANDYEDIYIINENSHNIFYVKGIKIKENNETKIYYTDYIEPDETTIDLRYIDGILIPEEYYYIGKSNDGNIVISKNKDEQINDTSEEQYIWQKNISKINKIPDSVKLSENQNEIEFIKSVNYYKGYFKNKNKTENIDIIYITNQEDKWSEVYTKETEYKDKNGDIAYIPQGFSVSMSPVMNTIENGLVIKDKNENQFVWIEVPKKITENCVNSEQIEQALMEYTEDYKENGYSDSWNEKSNLSQEQYNEDKNKMLDSIKENGGFWISRYEIGDKTATDSNIDRTSNSGNSGVAVSKSNQKPYNYITCTQAQTLANNMLSSDNTDRKSNLLFGIQWDLVCKFLEERTALENTQIVNLYGLGGNMAEWSLEEYSFEEQSSQFTAREIKFEDKISYHKNYGVDVSNDKIGFRITIY